MLRVFRQQNQSIVDLMRIVRHFFAAPTDWLNEMDNSRNQSYIRYTQSDTLNYYLEKLLPQCLEEVRKRMIKSLIRSKAFNRARQLGRHWRVILDGTGLFYFREKHCDSCLVTTIKNEEGKEEKRYYHNVLGKNSREDGNRKHV